MNIRASREFASLSQFSVYMNRGLGGFHDFPSRASRPLTNNRYGVGEIVSPEQIDEQAFLDATAWTSTASTSLTALSPNPPTSASGAWNVPGTFCWISSSATVASACNLLIDFDKDEEITGIFTSGNILEDTFELTLFEPEQRQPPRVSVRWRRRSNLTAGSTAGVYSLKSGNTVRESGDSR